MIFLVWVGLVGDHAGAADLGARAGGGRHRDDRQDAGRVGARPPVADVLEIPHRPRLAGHEGDDLAGIEPAAAAESDHPVMAAGAQHREPASTLAAIGLELTSENKAGACPAAQDLETPARWRCRETGIGDHQRTADARLPAGIGEPADRAHAEQHLGRDSSRSFEGGEVEHPRGLRVAVRQAVLAQATVPG